MNMVDHEQLHRDYLDHVSALAAATGRACAASGYDGVVIHSGVAHKKSVFDDQYFPLRVVPHFAHWCPLAWADCAIVCVAGRKPMLLRNVARDYWDGLPAVDDEGFLAAFEVVDLKDVEQGRAHFPGGRLAFVGESRARAAGWGFADADVCPLGLLSALDQLRVKKSAYERECIAEANRIAAAGHAAVRDAFLAGDPSELELHLLYLRATSQDDAETPYKNIVALGIHAAVLHHVYYGKKPSGADALLLDAGAAFRGYHSDITRTYVKGASAGRDAFAALLAGMEKLQLDTCAAVRVGEPYEALHDLSHRLLAPVLREVGVIRGLSDGEVVERGLTRLFLPHGLGHSLGLQTHDVGCAQEKPRPDNPFLRNTTKIAAGQCFTIEPGCYFIPEKLAELRASPSGGHVDWSLVDELSRFGGVRIEDDVLVRERGIENFTRDAL